MNLKGWISVFKSGKKSLYILFFSFLFNSLSAQVFYSVDPFYLEAKQEGNNILTGFNKAYSDTTLDEFHNFFARNYLGNLGLPSPGYNLNYGTSNLGFVFYPYPYHNDIFTPGQAAYYRSRGPYASLTGIAGSKKLQVLKLFFTQTYRDKINIAVKFNRYTSLGYYLKQQTYTNNLCITSNYTGSKKRAGYYFYFINNSNKHQENGGIAGDTLSAVSLQENKDLLPVKISSATRENKEFRAMINPWARLNKSPDSAMSAAHYLQLKSEFSFNIYKYKDANVSSDKFYTLMYLDTTKTYDSSRVMKVLNEVSYSLLGAKKDLGFSVGYRNELNSVWQKADSMFMNNSVFTDAVVRKSFNNDDSLLAGAAGFESRFRAEYIFNGANSGNYKVESRSQLSLERKKNHRVFLDLLYENRSADYIYNYWVSNNFCWFNNGFGPQQTFQSRLGYTYNKRSGISFLFQNISNYLFFDNVALPRQYSSTIQNLAVTAEYSLVLFKHLGLYARDVFQSTSNTSYISIPGNIATARLYYTGIHFKNNLQIQFGAQLQYYRSFYGYAYSPATQVFYLQDRKTTGEYPFLDVYLNARIRPVNIFIKVENVLQGYAGTSYSFVPGYYQPDRAFRFGINWMFFD